MYKYDLSTCLILDFSKSVVITFNKTQLSIEHNGGMESAFHIWRIS